jgi:hypothetical protein
VDDAPAIDRQVYAAYPLAAERRAVFEDALSLLTAEPAPHTATTPVA